VSHGNNNTKNYRLLKDIDPTDLEFAIQAVDNSFHAGFKCSGTIGFAPGDPSQCEPTVEVTALSVCSQEQVILSAPAQSLWFSFKDGFLGINTFYAYSAGNSLKGDTIFYFNPAQNKECAMLKAWTIEVNNDTAKVQLSEKYACEGDTVRLSVEGGWQSITWSSTNSGNLGTKQTVDVAVSKMDSVIVRLVNTQGCHIVRKTAVKISKPTLTVTADHYKIVTGGDVQLQASGAQRYTWTPSEGLNQADIPNPVASPKSSTQYIVTGYDSLDCVGQADVTITVEMGGFIPNLFSPNDDGQNDQLKIYGLISAGDFLFTIYDREGSLVYKTSNVTEAVDQGWDGTKNGSKQPPGVYFWKVKGEIGSDRLLLNGKESGSIVLIR
jgi:gliding motility-associated-like protein